MKHYSLRTEQAYLGWIKRYILFQRKRHPREMGAEQVTAYLSHLAGHGHAAAAMQNQALAALLFLYKEVLAVDLPWLTDIERARKSKRLPVVLSRDEVDLLMSRLEGTHALMARMIYETGMRLMECLRLRIKDVDFNHREIIIRDGKGGNDRITMLHNTLAPPLRDHSRRVRSLFDADRGKNIPGVYLPDALSRNYPNAGKE